MVAGHRAKMPQISHSIESLNAVSEGLVLHDSSGGEEYQRFLSLSRRLEGWHHLRLCHGIWPKNNEIYNDFKKERKNRLYRFRKIFEEQAESSFGDAFKKPSRRNGQKSTVGIISFNSPEKSNPSKNSVKKILTNMPEFHKKFIEEISKDEFLNED